MTRDLGKLKPAYVLPSDLEGIPFTMYRLTTGLVINDRNSLTSPGDQIHPINKPLEEMTARRHCEFPPHHQVAPDAIPVTLPKPIHQGFDLLRVPLLPPRLNSLFGSCMFRDAPCLCSEVS